MIRKNPHGDLPQIHESAYVDQTAIIRPNAGGDGTDLPPGFYVSSTLRIGPKTDLSTIPRVPQEATDFSEDVVRTNHERVQGSKKLQNEF